jgi:hypothetical protein
MDDPVTLLDQVEQDGEDLRLHFHHTARPAYLVGVNIDRNVGESDDHPASVARDSIVGRSEMYSSSSARNNGITSVQTNGRAARAMEKAAAEKLGTVR